MLGGLLMVLPILITLWLFHWMYSTLEKAVIDPLALMVLWQVRRGQADVELPHWFETYAAPLIAIVLVLVLLYALGFFVHSRLRKAIDWILLRVPLMSGVYEGVRSVFQSMERQSGKQRSQRVVLIPFPHPGLKAAAFVTATCRDTATRETHKSKSRRDGRCARRQKKAGDGDVCRTSPDGWRRRESNPRPAIFQRKLLRA